MPSQTFILAELAEQRLLGMKKRQASTFAQGFARKRDAAAVRAAFQSENTKPLPLADVVRSLAAAWRIAEVHLEESPL